MQSVSAAPMRPAPTSFKGLMSDLNQKWHERALQGFMIIVLAHWAEHLIQAFQIYGLGWARPDSRGVLGQFFPWLVKSEALHYGYAVVMMIGLFLLRDGFKGRSHLWWMAALYIQVWHHFEHALLQGQILMHQNLFGAPVPTSIMQLAFQRVELHLFYNTIVFIPMVVAMYFHKFPPEGEEAHANCTCAYRPQPTAAPA